MEQKELFVTPRDYYRSLGKNEKSSFLNYLLVTYGMKYTTIRRKLAERPNGELTKLEEMAIIETIESGKWKQ